MTQKIQIKSIFGSVLFEFEKEDNSIRETLIQAVKSGANLFGANLSRAEYRDIEVKKMVLFNGLYKYISGAIIDKNDKQYIILGCYCLPVETWKKKFWNNPNEFTDHKSKASQERKAAYNVNLAWLNNYSKI